MSFLCRLEMTLPRGFRGFGVTVRLMSDGELQRLEVQQDLDRRRLVRFPIELHRAHPSQSRPYQGRFVRGKCWYNFSAFYCCWRRLEIVLPGLVPGIHAFISGAKRRGWPGQARPRRRTRLQFYLPGHSLLSPDTLASRGRASISTPIGTPAPSTGAGRVGVICAECVYSIGNCPNARGRRPADRGAVHRRQRRGHEGRGISTGSSRRRQSRRR